MYEDFFDSAAFLASVDSEVAEAIGQEHKRQKQNIELIASENIVSPAVMAAMGSVLTNKYAEGYSGRRYYGGCECVDIVEDLAVERAKQLFGAAYANVQPHSGSQANFAVYFALLKPGDRVLGMNLNDGGHLTHGSMVNVSGKYFSFSSYGIDENGYIDYDAVERQAMAERPRLIIAGASAYARVIDFARFGEIAKKCGAYLMVDMAHIAGLVAAGEHPSPLPYADVVTTTTHKTLRGPRGGLILTNSEEIAKAINKSIFPGIQGGPLMHIIAAKAVSFKEALSPEFKTYQAQVVANAKALAQALTEEGMKLVSGGTDNHLVLVDLTDREITGKELENRLGEICITANKNSVPNDPRPHTVTSGVRLGTPAVTTRGMNTEDMKKIAHCVAVSATDMFEQSKQELKQMVEALSAKYPIY